MSHIESLFLSTLRDLKQRIDDTDEYNILGASALIRKLLIDNPLVDQVNQEHRLKLTFEISDSVPLSLPDTLNPAFSYYVQDGLDPDTCHRPTPITVNRDQLLAAFLIIDEGKAFTLREIVLFEANVMGGVHAGSPKNEKHEVLQAINGGFSIGGYRGSLRQMKAIGRVVLKGLEPLRAVVASRYGVS